MASPQIDQRTGELFARTGDVVSIQISALNSPTSWSATGLPDGLTIDASGVISGTVTAARNIYGFTITATNVDGSDAVSGYFVVADRLTFALDGTLELELLVDTVTKQVVASGFPSGFPFGPPSLASKNASDGDGGAGAEPLFSVKTGENIPVSVSFLRNGVRQDLDVAEMTCVAKEYEPELFFQLFSGGVTKVGSGESTRYRTNLLLDPDAWLGILSGYEDDRGTALDALAEIRAVITESGGSYDSSLSQSLSPQLSGSATSDQTKSFSFTGIPKNSTPVTFDFDSALSVTGNSAQNASISRTVDISWNGTEYEVSNLTGSASSSGTDNTANGEWRSTLSFSSISANSSGVTINMGVEASDVSDRYEIRLDLNDNPDLSISSGVISHTLGVGNGVNFYGVTDDGATEELFTITHGDTSGAVLGFINALPSPLGSEASAVYFLEGTQEIVVVLTGGAGDLAKIRDDSTSYEYLRNQLIAGGSYPGNVSASLSVGTVDTDRTFLTETFITRLERSLHS